MKIVEAGGTPVAHHKPAKILKPDVNRGYCRVNLYINGTKKNWNVHHLVLFAFVGPKHGRQICRHLNGVRSDNRPENLHWGTYQENEADKALHGTRYLGEQHPSAKLCCADVLTIRKLIATGTPITKIAEDYSVTTGAICCIRSGATWSHLATHQT